MKITDYLSKENIFLDVELPDKIAVLDFIAKIAEKSGVVKDSSALFEGLLQRERTMSTGVGRCFGFPHTTSPEADNAAVILVRLSKPIHFDSLDNKPVDIILSLIIPQRYPEIHVRLLARISRLCQNSRFVTAVRENSAPSAVWQAMADLETSPEFI